MVSGFPIAPVSVTVKVVMKAACDPENLCEPAMNVHWRKSTNERQGKPKQMRLSEQSLELVSVFKEASRTLYFFSLSRQAENC
jgi:hypothetical protein